jgi:cell wall-associated NlpC family hydrolase
VPEPHPRLVNVTTSHRSRQNQSQLEAPVQRFRGTFLASLLVVSLAVAASLAPADAFAAPTSPAIQAKQAEAAAAQDKLQSMSDDLETKIEDYNAVTEALDKTRQDIQTTRDQLTATEKRLSDAEDVLAVRAEGMYKGGGVDMVQVLLGTDSFEDFVARIELLDAISRQDAQLVADVKDARQKVASQESALENRETEQVALRQQAESKKAEVQAAVAQQSAFLASLNAEVQQLIKEQEAQQAAIAAALAAKAKAAAQSSAGRTPGAPGATHDGVVGIALQYLGVPYLWGGTTPSGFDCSGFVQYCYRQVSVNLPRTSREQFKVGTFIAASDLSALKPGDLLFFGYNADPSRIHHVAMYVGNGNFIHAPGTGDHVKISSLADRITNHKDYVGAVRP